MVMIHKNLGEAGAVIAALKVSNQDRQMIIDNLIAEGIEKDKEIAELKRQLKLLEGVIDRSRKK